MITGLKIAGAVLEELNGRNGFDSWWDSLDKEIQDEIVMELVHRIDECL